jgi:cytochrome c peroxidase
VVPRNTLPLWGRGANGFNSFFWDGKVAFSKGNIVSQFGSSPPSKDLLTVAVHLPIVELGEMVNDVPLISKYKAETLGGANTLYSRLMNRINRTEPEAIKELAKKLQKPVRRVVFLDVARSISAFIRASFRLKNTKFHNFVYGKASLNDDELKGGLIFYGKGKCSNCHHGAHFSDFKFHAIPFPQLGFGKNGFGVDYGRFNVTFQSEDLYHFRTPPLFNVTRTGPYGHSGSVKKLSNAIVAHFDPLRMIDPKSMDKLTRHEFFKRMAAIGDDLMLLSHLSDREVSQLESFLGTLNFDQ